MKTGSRQNLSDFDDTGRALKQANRLRLSSIVAAMLVVAIFSVGAEYLLERHIGTRATTLLEILIIGIALFLVTAPLSTMLKKSIVELHQVRERWRFDAIRDSLTGLFNRRHFDSRLREETARTRRHGNPLSVIVADIDRFKQLNDRFGHPAGDNVLRYVASRIRQMFRREDVVARIGGDEFGVVLPDTALPDSFDKAQRLRDSVDTSDETDLPVTISCGVAAADELSAEAEELLRRADESLYDAKSRRNSVAAVQLDDVEDLRASGT